MNKKCSANAISGEVRTRFLVRRLVCPRILAMRLWTARRYQAVTQSCVWYELHLSSIHSGGSGLTVLQVTALVSRYNSSSLVGWSGTCTCLHANQGGPLHHSGWSLNDVGDSPLEAQSAGFCSVGMCFQDSGGTRLVMAEMRLATKVLYLFGVPSNHARTMELSLQA